jgi:hypothetical protein
MGKGAYSAGKGSTDRTISRQATAARSREGKSDVVTAQVSERHDRGRLAGLAGRSIYLGSNDANPAGEPERLSHFMQELKFLSEEDKDWIMGRAILARLKWS